MESNVLQFILRIAASVVDSLSNNLHDIIHSINGNNVCEWKIKIGTWGVKIQINERTIL